MSRFWLGGLVIVWLLWVGLPGESIAEDAASQTEYQRLDAQFAQQVRPTLMKYCAGCHSPEEKENPVRFLQATNLRQVAQQRGIWGSVAEQLRNRTMPPSDETQPSEQQRLEIAAWIDDALQRTACLQGPYAGVVTTRRLNRTEYENTIRDLLGVHTNASDSFPVDGSGGEGFDNNGETLFLPPILMERYLEAAKSILNQAIITPQYQKTIAAEEWLPASDQKTAQRIIAPKSKIATPITVYIDSKYLVRLETDSPPSETKLLLKVDGIKADEFVIPSQQESKQSNQKLTSMLRLSRGTHLLQLSANQVLTLKTFRIEEQRESLTEAQRKRHEVLLTVPPGTIPDHPDATAEQILQRLLRRAFRRPLESGEMEPFLQLYRRARERGDPFEEAIKLALQGVLISPAFLFRIEAPPQSEKIEPISDHELATRLSYFLWSSMPDEELFRLAASGKLNDSETLLAQVDRMLDDPTAMAFAENFVGQWLGTREVGARVAPDTNTFRGQFTTELLLDLREEPVHFFRYLIQHNRPLLELLDSDYGIINRRLLEHYGYAGEKKKADPNQNPWTKNPQQGSGGPFQRFDFPDNRRGGLLGMGAVHMLTSYPNRTSPVLRGGWVLETLLGVHVPSPPPDVPELKSGRKSKKSVREQLAMHRDNPSCAACHNLMDPVGFALDHFDVLGRWREKENGRQIDASAKLPSGESFQGPSGLRKTLLKRKDEFARHLTKKMLGYALGRSLTDADDCTINQISNRLKEHDYQTRVLIREVVLSVPFRNRQQEPSTQPSQHGQE